MQSHRCSGTDFIHWSWMIALLICAACASEEAEVELRSAEVEFVDSRLCWDCHQAEYESWKGSHHDLAMQEATSETILGDFENTSFSHFGVTTHFFRKGEVTGRVIENAIAEATEGPRHLAEPPIMPVRKDMRELILKANPDQA